MKYKFKIGDTVEIILCGFGYSGCIGEIVTILELGVYFDGPGYRTTIPTKGLSSAKNKGMADEISFRLVKSNKNINYEIY
jgi:hypothetical protein